MLTRTPRQNRASAGQGDRYRALRRRLAVRRSCFTTQSSEPSNGSTPCTRRAASMPFFALSWALTLLSHDLDSVAVLARLFDFLLAHNPSMICHLIVAVSGRLLLLSATCRTATHPRSFARDVRSSSRRRTTWSASPRRVKATRPSSTRHFRSSRPSSSLLPRAKTLAPS